MDELVKQCRDCIDCLCGDCKYEHLQKPGNFVPCMNALLGEAADAIEELSADCDMYRKGMTDEHNRAAKLAWEKEHCWISTEELLPKDLQNVLVIDDGRVTIGHCEHFYGDEQIFVEWHDMLYYPIDPPYWMSLPPAPPKEE